MSLAVYSGPTSTLTAQRGGLVPTTAPIKMRPSEIALTLSADVLRLPYPPAMRLMLAEIVSLYAATGLCDASDAHFAARLSISTDTVSRAVKELTKDGLVAKATTMQASGLYRTLIPLPTAIAAKAQTNPYPQNAARSTRKILVGYPQNAGTPTRKMPVEVPAKCGSNTPYDIPVSFQVTPPSANASAVMPQKKIEEGNAAILPAQSLDIVPPIARPPRKKVSELDEPEHFAAFWAVYLRHDDRPAAVKRFARLNAEDQAQAAERATRWLARRTNWVSPDGTDYRPYAATWLNKRRWTELNEPLPTPIHASSHSQRPAASSHYSQASRSGSARQPITEGIQIGPVLTGSLNDL